MNDDLLLALLASIEGLRLEHTTFMTTVLNELEASKIRERRMLALMTPPYPPDVKIAI